MDNMGKLNNYHFGRHVFDYFPWYTYTKDTNNPPQLNEKVFRLFQFAFESNSVWVASGGYFYIVYKNPESYFSDDSPSYTIYVENNLVKYCSISEEISDWEDIEKIHLRCSLGTKEKADKYMEIINLYKKYYDIINDSIYLETEEEGEISIVNSADFINRNEIDVIASIVDESHIYSLIKENKLVTTSKNYYEEKFLKSISDYYKKNGFLTTKQVEAVKKGKLGLIAKSINKTFITIKTNHISNSSLEHIISYLKDSPLIEKKLNIKKLNGLMLIYE